MIFYFMMCFLLVSSVQYTTSERCPTTTLAFMTGYEGFINGIPTTEQAKKGVSSKYIYKQRKTQKCTSVQNTFSFVYSINV